MSNLLRTFFHKVSDHNRAINADKKHSFTYYIPGPPERKSGYREKQFDQYMRDIFEKDVEIVSINTQTHSGEKQSGMWVIVIVKALTDIAHERLLDFDKEHEAFLDTISDENETSEIDGFYKIND